MLRLDKSGMIFTQQQIDSLYKYVPGILDTNKQQPCNFLEHVFTMYKRRILNADNEIAQLAKQPLNFTEKDSITYGKKDKTVFVKDDDALKKRRAKFLKYEFIDEILSPMIDSSLSEKEINSIIKEKDKSTREKISLYEHCRFQKLIDNPDGFESSVVAKFFESIAESFDPHTEYFSMSSMRGFASLLSSAAGSCGMTVIADNGKLKVHKLVPGGPAWKSNLIHKGDYVEKIITGKASYNDLSCMGAQEVESIIDNSEGSWVEIEIRGRDGKTQNVKLVKEVMRVEDNKVNSCILNGKIKAGYISLPDFYASAEFTEEPGCANDVAKEILKMKQDGIEGLILDLRFNGGGSIDEALGLAGLFIDAGPFTIMRNKTGRPSILKDPNRGTLYDGNVIVMVNGLSASASEFLASTLKEYNRAVIVGQETYGKATAQRIHPFGTKTELRGFVKITGGKIYKLNGESNQENGVMPDIYFPGTYEGFYPRETDNEHVLKHDTINKNINYPSLPLLPIDSLKARSNKRVTDSKSFAEVRRKNKQLQENFVKENRVALQPKEIFDWMKKSESIFSDQAEQKDSNIVFKVVNNKFDEQLMKFDNFTREFIESNNKNIVEDIEINEAYSVLKDLNELKQP
jgi:carboxyl-terminal processing protease